MLTIKWGSPLWEKTSTLTVQKYVICLLFVCGTGWFCQLENSVKNLKLFKKMFLDLFILLMFMSIFACLWVCVLPACPVSRDQKTQVLCKSNNAFLIAESSPQPQVQGYCSLNKLGLATHSNPSTGMASDENQSTSLCRLGQQPHLCHQGTDSATKKIWSQPWMHPALSQHKEGPAFNTMFLHGNKRDPVSRK